MTRESKSLSRLPDEQNDSKQPFYSNILPDSVDMVHITRTYSNVDHDDSLVSLRDSLLSLAEKYPAHARSISQIASSVEFLMCPSEYPAS